MDSHGLRHVLQDGELVSDMIFRISGHNKKRVLKQFAILSGEAVCPDAYTVCPDKLVCKNFLEQTVN